VFSSADSHIPTRSTTLVVTRPSHQAFVLDRALRAGRRDVVTSIPPATWDGRSNGWLPAAAHKELVVDGALLPVVQEHNIELLRHAEGVHVFDTEGGPTDPFAEPIAPPWAAAKRVIDIAGAAVLLLVTLPIIVAAMVAIRVSSPGPTLFRQERVGKRGRRFTLLKVRTMVPDNDDSEHERYVAALIDGTAPRCNGMYKLDNDPRVTPIGRILRRSSIDELPQLWNVLRGDMSLVGPRPPLPRETERYDATSWARLLGRPGITGLWQVSGRCERTFGEQVALDAAYWRQWSLWLDLCILARTPLAVLSARGAA